MYHLNFTLTSEKELNIKLGIQSRNGHLSIFVDRAQSNLSAVLMLLQA